MSTMKILAWILCSQLCRASAAAFLLPMQGSGRRCGSQPTCPSQEQVPSLLPAMGEINLRRRVVLRAKLTRQHDFGIDSKKVDNLFDRIEALDIDLTKDIEEKFIRGSGAGGQKINKTSNNVQLIHLPTGTQVNSQRERMREKNRFLALRDLVEKLEVQQGKGGGAKTAAERAADKKRKQKARRKRKSGKKLAAGVDIGNEQAVDAEEEEHSQCSDTPGYHVRDATTAFKD